MIQNYHKIGIHVETLTYKEKILTVFCRNMPADSKLKPMDLIKQPQRHRENLSARYDFVQ